MAFSHGVYSTFLPSSNSSVSLLSALSLMVALERGAYTIGDETKEQTEFNLGKNFL